MPVVNNQALQIVPADLIVKLKELGYNWPASEPAVDLALKWLREVHNLEVNITCFKADTWVYDLYYLDPLRSAIPTAGSFETNPKYEDAQLLGLSAAIKYLQKKLSI